MISDGWRLIEITYKVVFLSMHCPFKVKVIRRAEHTPVNVPIFQQLIARSVERYTFLP